ncbi:hypothetical protein NLJ89_g3182 [Agrocybe chaxingu]|uniref:Pyridoxamine 5'-phosphate oxidase N-terminal domain-containing protein n=1 Tax=Agrocybe chaxingu TaxID=84603 RepID=A0A9W8K549_9AGAR|nr:hypothetical protein NLJ89_g3182 [Agrocybe chaxingu]
MGHFVDEIPPHLAEWIQKQQMFWVASAPLSPDGHVNVSPKAIEATFHVVNSRRVWYEDLSGTGAETVSHIRENGRVTILFHAFEGPARIVRLYGKGFFYEIGTPEYEALLPADKRIPGSRAVIGLDVHKVGTTCGYAVPYYKFIGHRTQLVDWAARKEAFDHEDAITPKSAHPPPSALTAPPPSSLSPSPSVSGASWRELINPKGMVQWWQSRNLTSIDGLPAFSVNLGRGFPFGFSIRPAPIQNPRPLHKERSIAPTMNASYLSTAQKLEESPELPSDVMLATQRQAYRDISTLTTSVLPFLLTLIIGVWLGRMYETHISGDQGSRIFQALRDRPDSFTSALVRN